MADYLVNDANSAREMLQQCLFSAQSRLIFTAIQRRGKCHTNDTGCKAVQRQGWNFKLIAESDSTLSLSLSLSLSLASSMGIVALLLMIISGARARACVCVFARAQLSDCV